MDQRADRAMVVRGVFATGRIGRRIAIVGRRLPAGAPAEGGAMRSRCTWPNETASWNASANSARYAPNLERDRNQLIVVTLRASDAATEPFCRRTRGLCYNI